MIDRDRLIEDIDEEVARIRNYLVWEDCRRNGQFWRMSRGIEFVQLPRVGSVKCVKVFRPVELGKSQAYTVYILQDGTVLTEQGQAALTMSQAFLEQLHHVLSTAFRPRT